MLYRQCCVCRRFEFNKKWVRIVFEMNWGIDTLTHTYCPNCLNEARIELGLYENLEEMERIKKKLEST